MRTPAAVAGFPAAASFSLRTQRPGVAALGTFAASWQRNFAPRAGARCCPAGRLCWGGTGEVGVLTDGVNPQLPGVGQGRWAHFISDPWGKCVGSSDAGAAPSFCGDLHDPHLPGSTGRGEADSKPAALSPRMGACPVPPFQPWAQLSGGRGSLCRREGGGRAEAAAVGAAGAWEHGELKSCSSKSPAFLSRLGGEGNPRGCGC